jgi:hypothetical protein
MLLQNTTILENVIVKLLQTAKDGLSASEIRDQVNRVWKTYSSRGIYKELARLENEGIVLRSCGKYSLRLAWLVSLYTEVAQLFMSGNDPELLKNFLPKKGQEIIINCSDLVRWDRIWTQLMLTLNVVFPNLPMFVWLPRHWFNFTHPDIEKTFILANEASKNLRYTIVGGRGWLDRHDQKSIARKSVGYSFRLSPFENDRTNYHWVIGDYVGVSTINSRVAHKIDEIYENAKELSDIPSDISRHLISQNCNGKVRCIWAPQKAEKLRRQFLDHFGLETKDDGTLVKLKLGEL